MNDVVVNFNALATGHQDVVGVLKSLHDTLANLESDLNPLIASWSGEAQLAYGECKNNWEQAAGALAGILNQVATGLDTTHQNYRQTEASNTSMWRQGL